MASDADILSIAAIVIAGIAAICTICFGGNALKDIVIPLFTNMWLWPVFGSYRHEWLKSHVTMAIGQNTNVDQDILYLFRGINLNDSWCNHSILLDILDMRIKARKMDIYPSSKYENDPLIRKTKNGIFIWKDIMDPIMTLTKDSNIDSWKVIEKMIYLIEVPQATWSEDNVKKTVGYMENEILPSIPVQDVHIYVKIYLQLKRMSCGSDEAHEYPTVFGTDLLKTIHQSPRIIDL